MSIYINIKGMNYLLDKYMKEIIFILVFVIPIVFVLWNIIISD